PARHPHLHLEQAALGRAAAWRQGGAGVLQASGDLAAGDPGALRRPAQMTPETRDKLLRVGARPVIAALAKHGLRHRARAKLPAADPFAGDASISLESCRAGSVLIADGPPAAHRERLARRGIAGIVTRRELGGVAVDPGDAILRDRDSIVVIPATL